MADKNETFEFQIKADIKQLQHQLKQIPGMTKEEASKMVRALSAEMRKANTAAKKAAAESKKAAAAQKKAYDEAAKAAKKSIQASSVSYTKSINNSKKATQSFTKDTRKNSREVGAAFGSLEDVVSALDPELAGLASTVGVLGQGLRSLSRSLATGNMVIVGAITVIAALAVGYTLYNSKQREAERQQKVLAKSLKKTNERFSEQSNIIRSLNQTEAETQRELMVITGQMTQLESDKAALREKSLQAIERDTIAQNVYIREQEKILDLANKAAKSKSSLTEEETKILEMALMQSKSAKIRNALNESNVVLGFRMAQFAKEQNKNIQTQKTLLLGIQQRHEQNLQNQIDILELKAEEEESDKVLAEREKQKAEAIAKRAELEAEAEKQRAKAEKERLRLLAITERMESKLQVLKQKSFSGDIQIARQAASFIEDESERKKVLIEIDKKVLSNKIQQIEKEKASNLSLAETEEQKRIAKLMNQELDEQIEDLKEEHHLKEMERSKDRIKANEKEVKSRIELAQSIIGTFSTGAKATAELIQTLNKENKKAALIAFRINQAAALADIAMNTAVQISKVAGNPFAIAAVTAVGGIQAANVLAQSPPEMHMGGFIGKGEDTRNITVLTGEAVLNRRTVQNLGGEQGINQLQRGGSIPSQEVIVMSPFKHFDRYARASISRGGALSKITKKKASGAY